MEFVATRFMEDVIELLFYATAQTVCCSEDMSYRNPPYWLWDGELPKTSTHFSGLRTWSNYAAYVSRTRRFVQLEVKISEERYEAFIRCRKSVQVFDSLTWSKKLNIELEDLVQQKIIVVDLEIRETFIDQRNARRVNLEELTRIILSKVFRYSSSAKAKFSRFSLQDMPNTYKFMKTLLKTGVTIAGTEFSLAELLELKRAEGLRKHQLNFSRAVAEDMDPAEILGAIHQFNFEHIILKPRNFFEKVLKFARSSKFRELEITVNSDRMAELLPVISQHSHLMTVCADLAFFRELNRSGHLRTLLTGQSIGVVLNYGEDSVETAKFLFDNLSCKLTVKLPGSQKPSLDDTPFQRVLKAMARSAENLKYQTCMIGDGWSWRTVTDF